MLKVIEAKAMPGYRLWVRYADGTSGTADLSHLVGRGVFSLWNDREAFERVYIDPESGAIAWSEQIDLCPDALYMRITGQTPEQVFPEIRKVGVDA